MSSPPDINSSQPRIVDVYETVLYGSDIDAVARFYRDIVGLPLIQSDPDLLAALRLPGGGVLLIFDPVAAAVPGRPVPSHGAEGAGHVAFRVEDLTAWRAHLADRGVEIEREIDWGAERLSVYVRDPAGNSVEFVRGELW
jgi:catechol 2,3-dioxygenase-like lactoylglutathione lyase family enzyme